MPLAETLQRMGTAGLIAVIRAESADEAVRAVGALIEGGVPAVELTFTTPGVEAALREVRATFSDAALIGAGSIRNVTQVALAHACGAEFLVSPNLRGDVLAAMLATGLLSVPGIFTPTEVDQALDLGAEVVKLFPASTGGTGHLKSLLGPFPDLAVIPTGGVDIGNIGGWLAAGAFAVGVGGEICTRALMKEGNWTEITRRAREFANAVKLVREGAT